MCTRIQMISKSNWRELAGLSSFAQRVLPVLHGELWSACKVCRGFLRYGQGIRLHWLGRGVRAGWFQAREHRGVFGSARGLSCVSLGELLSETLVLRLNLTDPRLGVLPAWDWGFCLGVQPFQLAVVPSYEQAQGRAVSL